MAQRSLAKRLWYEYLHIVCRLIGAGVFHIRCQGREHLPRCGGALLLSNHQSHFDPVLMGLAVDRRLNYLARESLFGFAPFRWLIQSLDAIPIDREGLGLAGLKETLRRLRNDEVVLIFPEGARTVDGLVAPLKPGFSALAKRARVPLVPAAIEGAFDAWPRRQALPGIAVLEIVIGEPIMPDEAQRFDDRDLVAEVERRISACHARARSQRDRRLQRHSRVAESGD